MLFGKKDAQYEIKEELNKDPNYLTPSTTNGNSQELELLYQINMVMLEEHEGQQCDKIVCLVGEYTEAWICSLWLIESLQVIRKIRKGFYNQETENLQKVATLDFELTDSVIVRKEPFILGKNNSIEDKAIDGKLMGIGLPIMVHGEMVGTLNLWLWKETGIEQIGDEVINTLSKVVQNIALGIKNNLLDRQHQLRIKKELEIAQRIQVNLVPRSLPSYQGISIGVRAVSANEVGGDYLDLITTTNKNLGIVIGDVMGKGIPASLHMVMTRTVFRSVARNDLAPNLVLREINSVLYPDLSPQGIFVTLFYGLYHPDSKLLLYANAAHNPPIVYRAHTGEYVLLKAKGVFIGGKENSEYALQSIQLSSGDVIVFYSDGLKEAMNKSREQFGIGRIIDTVKNYAYYDAASITDCLYMNQLKFTDFCEQNDDITFAVLKID